MKLRSKKVIVLIVLAMVNVMFIGNVSAAVNDDLKELAVVSSKSVVRVFGLDKGKRLSSGSGFMAGKKGFVITAAHVKTNKKCNAFTVQIDDETTYKAELIFIDEIDDVMILKTTAKHVPLLEFNIRESLEWAEGVFIIGYPRAHGKVFKLGRFVSICSLNYKSKIETVQHQVTIKTTILVVPGNSGGPVIDYEGKVVSMVICRDLEDKFVSWSIPAWVIEKHLNTVLAKEIQE